VPAGAVSRLVPGVRPGRGGVVFWDGQLADDARLVVTLARTAAAYGAQVLTGATVTGVDGDRVQVELADGGTGALRAGVVVNAAGVWAQRLAPGIRLVPSRGSHLVVPAALLGSPTAALTVPLPGSRSRYVFALPQPEGLVYLGITDEPVEGPVPDADPVPSDAEVDQLLETVDRVLAVPLRRADLAGAYAGLRPLVLPASAGTGPGDATADLSRKHLLSWDGSVLTVVGGKLTTYRAMAEEAVDAVVARLGRGAPRSVTARLPLVGAAPRAALDRVEAPARLVARYGTEAPAVAALGAEPLVEGRPETVGELRFAVLAEGARTVADLLDRRTRLGLVPADRSRAVGVAERVLAEPG
jgi:glycerol-3-phosphate dehydrogenase